MKNWIIGLLLLIPLQFASGQDKIITIQQDTIFCRIVSVSPSVIHYEQKGENQQVVGKFIPTEQVLEYFRSSQSSEITPYYRINRRVPKPERPWVIGVQAGGSSLLASTDDDEREMINMGIPQSQARDYNRQLKHGGNLGCDIHYLLFESFGLGVKYSFFTSSAQNDFMIKINDYYPEYVSLKMKDNQYIHYVGPSVIFQQWLDENHKFQLNEALSMGYVHYRDELRMNPGQNALVESNTWGVNACLSAEYFPVSYLSIGLNAGLMYARLTKVDISTKESTQTINLDKKDYEPLSRLDYSLSIRFHF
jgi:hypothetical protein